MVIDRLRGGETMDIYCTVCGEPWSTDTLHDAADDTDSTFDRVRKVFFQKGCGVAFAVWGIECLSAEAGDAAKRAEMSRILYDVLGSDIDAIAVASEDAIMFGMLD
jgi:hypothetical protein